MSEPGTHLGWDFLLSEPGFVALTRTREALQHGADPAKLNSGLRAEGLEASRVAAVLTQAGLQIRATAKFGEQAQHLLFTQAGLEQATRRRVAESHAARFAGAGCRRVADLGCGIAAESLALLAAGVTPLPVEIDAFTAELASHNLRRAATQLGVPSPTVITGNAERVALPDADGVFLDPARRTAGHSDTRRIAASSGYSPSLEFAFGLSERMPTGIKLGPGFDRDEIPDRAEAQWVSVDGQLVETGLWFGAAARPGVTRAALVLSGERDTAELTASSDAEDAPVRHMGEYLYEPDGAVIRARLIGTLAGHLGAGMLSEGIAYMTGDSLEATPFATRFRVLDTLPTREKDLRRALSSRGIGVLEIKKRGADVDPAALRKRLKLRGRESATLFLTRDRGGKHTALLAERV